MRRRSWAPCCVSECTHSSAPCGQRGRGSGGERTEDTLAHRAQPRQHPHAHGCRPKSWRSHTEQSCHARRTGGHRGRVRAHTHLRRTLASHTRSPTAQPARALTAPRSPPAPGRPVSPPRRCSPARAGRTRRRRSLPAAARASCGPRTACRRRRRLRFAPGPRLGGATSSIPRHVALMRCRFCPANPRKKKLDSRQTHPASPRPVVSWLFSEGEC